MEVEAKLLAKHPAVLDAIARKRRLAGFRIDPGAEEVLETTYLDTRDRALLRHRIAFRIRRTPRGYELTTKLPGVVEGDVHRRAEETWFRKRAPRIPFSPRSGELRERLLPFTRGRSLVPLVATRIRRRTLLVRPAGGRGILAEIALDEVELRRLRPARGGVGAARYCEVEIELKRGRESILGLLARALRAAYGLRPSRRSKLERALRWAGVRSS